MLWICTMITVFTRPLYDSRWRSAEIFRGAFAFKGSWSLLFNVLAPLALFYLFKYVECFENSRSQTHLNTFADLGPESPTSAAQLDSPGPISLDLEKRKKMAEIFHDSVYITGEKNHISVAGILYIKTRTAQNWYISLPKDLFLVSSYLWCVLACCKLYVELFSSIFFLLCRYTYLLPYHSQTWVKYPPPKGWFLYFAKNFVLQKQPLVC